MIGRVRRVLDYLESPALVRARWLGLHVGFVGSLLGLQRRFGIVPGTIIDVGANVGRFSQAARLVFPEARILSFEPNPSCAAALRKRCAADHRWSVFEFALAGQASRRDFHVTGESELGSLLVPEDGLAQSFGRDKATASVIEVETHTLDEVLKPLTLAGPMLLKVDVQGAELEVLRGARETLARCTSVKLEVSFDAFYRGQPGAAALFALLEPAGFRRFIVEDAVISNATVHWCDLVMLRDPTALR